MCRLCRARPTIVRPTRAGCAIVEPVSQPEPTEPIGEKDGGDGTADFLAEADRLAVLAANAAYYDAFERRDFDAISDLWEHSDRVLCTHPGWSTLHGWGAVSASWVALLTNSQRLQFILTNERVGVAGETAWVSIDENVIDGAEGSTVAALNVFVRSAGSRNGWRMVVHHASLVHASLGS